MTKLLQRLHDELVRRNYATTTRESYLRIVESFRRRTGGRLDRLGADDLRRYQVYLLVLAENLIGALPQLFLDRQRAVGLLRRLVRRATHALHDSRNGHSKQ